VTNFAAHDDKAVYIRVGSRRVYELKLFGNCLEMSWVHSLALRTFGDSNVCEGSNPNLELFTRDIATGRQRCPVTSVRELDPQEVAALPKDARP
jgi:hypothetical protein